MVRRAANPWLSALVRAGKKQQRTATRALTKLLLAPAPKAKPKSRPKSAPAPKTAPSLQPPVTRVKPGTRVKPVMSAKPAPKALAPAAGKWLTSYYSAAPPAGARAPRRMAYWLYLPDAVPAGIPIPLLVMLHGCDQSATQFAQGTRMNLYAEKKGVAVLYPQQSVSAHPHRCWKWYDRATQQGGGDVGAIVGMVRTVMAKYPIDARRVYICGLSAGAGMANIVALNHPGVFAALGLHSGPLYGAGHSQVGALGVMKHGASARVDQAIAEVLARHVDFPPLPTILIQGDDDQVVRPVNQAQLTRQAMLLNRLPAGCAVQVTDKPAGRRALAHRVHDLHDAQRKGRVLLRVAQVAGLAHAWSGGDANLAYNSAAGPDASKMMLDFFLKHRSGA